MTAGLPFCNYHLLLLIDSAIAMPIPFLTDAVAHVVLVSALATRISTNQALCVGGLPHRSRFWPSWT